MLSLPLTIDVCTIGDDLEGHMKQRGARPIYITSHRSAGGSSAFFGALARASLFLVCIFTNLSGPESALAQSNAATSIEKVYVDVNGRVHIVGSDGKDLKPPKEKGQVSSDSASIADDKETVGWLVKFPNCCTSYPIAMTLVIWRSGRIVRRFGNGMLIANWHFVAGGKQAAFSTNTVHGDFAPHCELRDLRSGHQIAKWDGPLTDKAPFWVHELSD
jgi:hypothetical protein